MQRREDPIERMEEKIDKIIDLLMSGTFITWTQFSIVTGVIVMVAGLLSFTL